MTKGATHVTRSAVRVRGATADDAPVIARMVAALLGDIMPPRKVAPLERLEDAARRLFDEGPGFAAYLAETSDGTPAGVAVLTEMGAVFALGRFGEVTELYVAPEFRSQRVGNLLIERAKEHARAAGWTRLELTAPHPEEADGAARAYAFYERLGFVEAGPRLKLPL